MRKTVEEIIKTKVINSQARGAGSKRSRNETVDPNAEELSILECFLDQIGIERDLDEEPEHEFEEVNEARTDTKTLQITDYEKENL